MRNNQLEMSTNQIAHPGKMYHHTNKNTPALVVERRRISNRRKTKKHNMKHKQEYLEQLFYFDPARANSSL